FNQKQPETLLKEIKNPSDVLFAIKQNGEFVIWETRKDALSVKLQIHDKQGNYISNQKITFSKPRKNWRETYMDGNDKIYSIYLEDKKLELYSWN
ncbi:MAG: hypothetical protein AAF518_28940, partial [Spirochaetota bacterium]